MKLKKIEKKLSKLEEKKQETPSEKIDKKIMKFEKKKAKKEKWLKIKWPFRTLITLGTTWVIIAGVSYGCSYVPVLKEVKTVAMAAVAYVAPEPVIKALDVVTLNVGLNNNDFEWLKTTANAYISGEIELETVGTDAGTGFTYDGENYTYTVNGKEVSESEYNKYIAEENEKLDNIAQKVFGTTSAEEMSSMSISEILMKVATNSTPELVLQFLDMSNLTSESKQRVQNDANKALKIIPKLNNNQMNELVEIINGMTSEIYNKAQETVNETRLKMEEDQKELEDLERKIEQLQNM